jgi:hypothetical protein
MKLADGTEITVHPAAEMFPMMDDAELDELAADIERNGLYEAIAYQNGELLDGRNRLAAIYRIKDEKRRTYLLGVVASSKRALEVQDPVAYVVSANLRRRHLTPKQKRDITAALLKERPERSNRATAKIAKVSDKTAASVRRELEGRAEIPNVDTRSDTKGRKQPPKNKSRSASATAPHRAPPPAALWAEQNAKVVKPAAETPPPLATPGPAAEPAELRSLLALLPANKDLVRQIWSNALAYARTTTPAPDPLAAAKAAVEALDSEETQVFETWFWEHWIIPRANAYLAEMKAAQQQAGAAAGSRA